MRTPTATPLLKGLITALVAAGMLASTHALAELNKGSHLNTSGQGKVNKALARGYMQSGNTDGYTRQQQQSQVNIGSKRAGTCTMNVGTTKPGEKAPKEVIVTSKEIINVCK
ncbi:hypothetical protein [Rhodocyclus purpureus]|uniref:hypothetical protein n=1 Tax=Rhodocyclus purpureus TaxID=1067 RepID=UPI001911522C|nr:hypothetical protein [Rhodocyclus purpureus]